MRRLLAEALAAVAMLPGLACATPDPARPASHAVRAPAPASPAASGAAMPTPAGLHATLDRLIQLGEDQPQRAMSGLDTLAPQIAADDAMARRALALARAEIAARSLSAVEFTHWRASAVILSTPRHPRLGDADTQYLEALQAERQSRPQALDLARAALKDYTTYCRETQPAAPDCEYRQRWRLNSLLALAASQRMARESAVDHAQQALDLAQAAGDAWRVAMAEGRLAALAAEQGRTDEAQQRLARATAEAARSGMPMVQARIALIRSTVAAERDDLAAMREALVTALALATDSGAERLAARVIANLSDLELRHRRPREALALAERSLPTVQRFGDRLVERVLLHNIALAKLALGRRPEARRHFEQLLALWAAEGNDGEALSSLREMTDALADAGDQAAALEYHHREHELSKKLEKANLDAALAAVRARYAVEEQQREIRRLAQDNQLKSGALENQRLSQGLWGLAAVSLGAAAVLLLLLARRMHETGRALRHNQAALKMQSERDALTGLANRRHFQALLHGDASKEGFEGALLMIDVDHFKHINDEQGHADGDAVLIELAARIQACVRSQDVVARWGGEEFLVYAPGLSAGSVRALGQRLLQSVGGQPVLLPGGQALRVTVSIGHAVFPLPPHRVQLTVEQAINLADMALYSAKGHGRNRAVGIERADVADAAALLRLEADFEQAATDQQVVLSFDDGPPDPMG